MKTISSYFDDSGEQSFAQPLEHVFYRIEDKQLTFLCGWICPHKGTAPELYPGAPAQQYRVPNAPTERAAHAEIGASGLHRCPCTRCASLEAQPAAGVPETCIADF